MTDSNAPYIVLGYELNNTLDGTGLVTGSDAMLQLALRLAKHHKKKLKIVHAVEPWFGNYAGIPVFGEWVNADEITKAEVYSANEIINEKLGNTGDVTVEVVVKPGKSHDIMREECEQGCFLTIVGSYKSESKINHWFSTTTKLINKLESPVLVVPDAKTKKGADGFTVHKALLADNLDKSWLSSLKMGYSFCTAFPGAHVHHCHVTQLSEDRLEAALRIAMTNDISASDAKLDNELSPKEICKDLHKKIMTMVEGRIQSCQDIITGAELQVSPVLHVGSVAEELVAYRNEINPDLEIYGKHRIFQSMPMEAMLRSQALVLVIP